MKYHSISKWNIILWNCYWRTCQNFRQRPTVRSDCTRQLWTRARHPRDCSRTAAWFVLMITKWIEICYILVIVNISEGNLCGRRRRFSCHILQQRLRSSPTQAHMVVMGARTTCLGSLRPDCWRSSGRWSHRRVQTTTRSRLCCKNNKTCISKPNLIITIVHR